MRERIRDMRNVIIESLSKDDVTATTTPENNDLIG